MANYFLSVLFFRILLPILIGACVIFRPSGLSSLYLVFLFILPFVPVPTEKTMSRVTGIYLIALIVISAITSLSQFIFQIVLMVMLPYGQFLENDEMLEKVLRNVGYVRLNKLNLTSCVTWVYPEVLMLIISVIVFVVMKKMTDPKNDIETIHEEGETLTSTSQAKHKSKKKYFSYLTSIGRYGVLIALCSAAVLRPSVPGGLYFLVFLSAATWWACYKQLRKGFAIVIICLLPIICIHISCLYAYQCQWIQEILDKNSPYARYFGFTELVNFGSSNSSSQTDPRIVTYGNEEWASYLNPFALYILFYILVLESKALLKPESQKKQGPFSRLESTFSGPMGRQMSQRLSRKPLTRSATNKRRWQSATRKVRENIESQKEQQPGETTPLIQGVQTPNRYGSRKKSGIFQDSTGSVTVTGENTEDIPLDELGTGTIEDEYKPTLFENIVFVFESILQVIIRSSYIGTNIIMMAWSITYLSWITFVLLIWANLIWLIPNQRRSMLLSSPLLVLYAIFLLVSGYVYSMNLTDDELPVEVNGIKLNEIGFVKFRELPCVPLFIKCLYTVMFWVTLRQFMQERLEKKQSSALADMVAPLQVTVGAAAGVNRDQEKGSKTMEKIGAVIKQFLTKFWIWIVAITLFSVAITGQRMTGFRIIYMALFLFFILTFQFSFKLWRKIMFGFWLTVIIYSMIILVLVYTYQFDEFPRYWTDYLHISKKQQADIGLEEFEIKQLFVRLVTPTFFVIITVIQLHYFHKDFMSLSDPKNTIVVKEDELNNGDLDQSSLQGGAAIEHSEKDEITGSSSQKFNIYDIGNMSRVELQEMTGHFLKKLYHVKNLIYVFLELHMIKIVLLFAMLVCVYDACAIYFIITILISLALTFGRPMQFFAIYTSSLLVSFVLLARMVYQIEYIDPGKFNVTCKFNENDTVNANNAQWLGFNKSNRVPGLVKWNIIYILVVALWTVVVVRQNNYRLRRGLPPVRAFFMFPKITRADSDKNLKNNLKYLANYGFYKFGVEITLMATVGLIGIRMDMYALLHSIWLCTLFAMKRSILSKIWVIYLIFIAVLLPFQYFMVIGLPPFFCQEFPWDKPGDLKNLKEWAFLLDSVDPPPVKKLICDFIVLLLVSRQWLVFRIEKRYAEQNYAGGSNESIIHHAEEKDFKNPVPDFITYVRSYLDIFKRGILLSFFWITLALVFLAGTNRVNIFSVGYLIGAFVFLWHGSDFYLKPIPKILRQWQWLLGYNVAVIFLKTSFQLIGCVYLHYVPSNYCWIIHLLGIGCVRKFGVLDITRVINIDQHEDAFHGCSVPREFIGIVWDGICFGFLIMQRRIFNSYNFFHIVDETKATTILASRGAELIEEIRLKTMKEQEELEHKVLEKIKMKMDRIKANQQKIQGASYKDKTSHSVDSVFKGRPKYRRKPPVTYKQAIRSGDYYMFDDLEDEEIDLLPEEKAVEEEDRMFDKPDIGELLSTVMKKDVDTAVRSRSNLDLKRQYSMPLARQKSARSQLSAAFSAPPTIDEHEPRSVRIREIPEDEDPQPGTSKDEEISELTEPKESIGRKILKFMLFIWAFIESAMISMINFLNSYSRDYRYVIRVLTHEKKILKEKTNYNVGVRIGSGQVWQPAGSYNSLLRQSNDASPVLSISTTGIFSPSDSYRLAMVAERMASIQSCDCDEKCPNSEDSDTKAVATPLPYSSEQERRKASVLTVPEIRILAPSLERGLDSPCSSRKTSDQMPYDYVEEMSSYDQPTIIRLFLAMWHIIMSRSDLLCYFVIFLNQMKTATFLSLPLPLMVFFWGSLTIPRPSKTFWITIIAYTEVIVLIKCIFQFDIMSDSGNLDWNSAAIETNPFYPPKIIGTYRQANYALWDLILLLVVFFHRVILKSMGIWTTSQPVTAGLLSDGDYKLENGQLVPVSSSSGKSTTDKDTSQPSSSSKKTASSRRKSKAASEEEENILSISTTEEEPLNHFPLAFQLAMTKYAESFKIFIQQLLDPTSRVAADAYSFMFMCDFANFLVILFGYSSFGTQQDGGVQSYIEDNRVPALFLFMLILQFMLIIIDRGIYLKKNILAKIIFQFIQIILLHIWLFMIFPIMTGKQFNSVLPPQIYYMIKCFYFLLSAYQIRCGYPTRILGNFLCKGYGYVNMALFRGFMIIPFLFELRTVMDWMWTETSMTVFDWIKMEDIFQHIYLLKCSRYVEDEYPQPRGEKKKSGVKYIMGGIILAIIIGIIWFPLVFFSLGNAVGQSNIPYDVSLQLRIGPYEPVYQISAQSNSIFTFTEAELNSLEMIYNAYKDSETFISNYMYTDVSAVVLSIYSANVWTISPPDRDRMVAEVNSSKPLTVRLEYKVSHKTSSPEDADVISENVEITIPPGNYSDPNSERGKLLRMLQGDYETLENTGTLLTYIMPKFLKVTNKGTAEPVDTLMLNIPDDRAKMYRNITLHLHRPKDQNNSVEWWEIHEECDDKNYARFLNGVPYKDCNNSIVLYTFNDKIFPQTLSFITGGGIIGLYTTLVLVASRVLRGVFTDQCAKIMFEDMPNVDRVLQLCLDIYLVREAREFCLEEDLFAKLVFLFRSPETLIKWTRPKEELGDDDDPEGDGQ